MRKIVRLFIILSIYCGLHWFCDRQTRGFAVHKILGVPLEWETKTENLNLQGILSQPFCFLSKGGQSYVFESQDKQYVLKFFKQHHIRFWNLLSRICFPGVLDQYRLKILIQHRHQSAPFLYESCRLAESLKEETGLVYLHLNRTEHLNQKCVIVDPLNIHHAIDLNQIHFALQKKVEPSYRVLSELIQTNQLLTAKACIDSLMNLMQLRCQKGVEDLDPNVRTNFGFLGTRAIAIDLGSCQKNPSLDPKKEVANEMQKFKNWLHQQSPELEEYLEEKLQAIEV